MTDTGARTTYEEDVVDLLLAQHARIEQLFLLVIGGTGDIRREAFDDLVKLLAAHETAEEEVVHPLARGLPGGGGDAMVDERLAEERQAKETLRTLVAGGVDAEGFETGIILLRDAVLTHARYEERHEFPRLRQHVPAEQLRGLAAAVRAAEATAPTRPHPGAQSATANLAMGPALAVIDRIRDAVRKPSEGKR
ncbi:hemerythrin domain-containing protein [Micromonospora sp. KC213]|uniref:hemerythrin domain-containing protein n=1 Tax=Micromonospora sp. KC213 TaxID=2530378 RepID=UPI0010440A9E|nr:hemerythrin domain-containing protein [Micromonospora sp. KC213]TDC44144.1 hemerythrin domain-containing protein [Micromonospora sp. KC213]